MEFIEHVCISSLARAEDWWSNGDPDRAALLDGAHSRLLTTLHVLRRPRPLLPLHVLRQAPLLVLPAKQPTRNALRVRQQLPQKPKMKMVLTHKVSFQVRARVPEASGFCLTAAAPKHGHRGSHVPRGGPPSPALLRSAGHRAPDHHHATSGLTSRRSRCAARIVRGADRDRPPWRVRGRRPEAPDL